MSGVYIVEFDIYPGLYKIGKSKNIETRIKQFQNSTILLDGAKLLYYKEFENYTKAEKDVHFLLRDYRCKENREFFKGDLQYFINVISSLNTDEYKLNNKEVEDSLIEINDRALIYLLQMQIDHLNSKINLLEEKQKSNFECLKEMVNILKEFIKRFIK